MTIISSSTRRSRSKARRCDFAEPLERRLLLAGLTAQYFDRVDFTDLKLTRTDATVNFNWGSAAPDPSMAADNFAVRWTGQVQGQFGENYTFYVKSDDGARLWVDGRLIVDNWVTQSATEKSATLPLVAGKSYDIRLDYYDATQSASAVLSWSSPSTPKQVIPSSRLFASGAGLEGTYFDNADFTGTSIERTDSGVNFDWASGSPDPSIAPSTYSARWTAQIVPQFSQTYDFYVTADAGATVNLRVDGQLVITSTSIQDSGEIQLEAGKRYELQLDYAHNTGAANVKLEWRSPSQARQVVPTSQLTAFSNDAIPTRVTSYTNSVNDLDRPDPGVIYADGYYWMTHTTGGPSTGWPLSRSSDMTSGWTSMGNMLNSSNKPAFMTDSFWAPEVHKINGQFVITGTANSSTYGHLVIAIGTASEITGPYTVRSTPIVNDSVSVLDSTIFQDFDGRVYLIWKRDGPSGGAFGSIEMRELDPANLTSFKSGSIASTLLANAGGGSWELNLEEAPWMLHRGSYYYLFYSGAHIDTTYAEGVARATSITGVYARYTGNAPILQSNSTWGGPGHGAFVQDADGTVWFYYHARHQDNTGYGRVQMIDRVIWSADGWPTFNGGTPSVSQQVGPRVYAASGSARYTVSGDVGGVVADDTFRVARNSSDSSMLDVQLNGVTQFSVPYAQIENLTFNGVGGNDTLILDESRGDVAAGSGVTFNGGAGSDTVRIIGASSSDRFHVTSAQIVHDTGLVALSATEGLSVQGGPIDIDGDLGGAAVDASAGATLLLHASQHLASLLLAGNASVALDAGGSRFIRVGFLGIAGGARLDLADNDLILDYSTVSPTGSWNGSAYTGVTGMIASGRGGGAWTGSGIVTSMSAAVAPNSFTTLAIAEAADVFGISAAQTTNFDGQTIDATTAIVKYTYSGDANLDGVVSGDDYFAIDSSFPQSLHGWTNGDLNFDGVINGDDYFLIDSTFPQQGAAL